MTAIAFLDTETTSLRPDRRAWEVGLIVRDENSIEAEHHWFVQTLDLALGEADPKSLAIGRFHERHPEYINDHQLTDVESEYTVMREVERLTRGAHLVGAVVNFDADVLAARMRAHGICPSWHYHLICVENLAIGYLAGSAAYGQSSSGAKRAETRALITPPWKSHDLCAALGVTVSEEDEHTALGDARWAMRVYDAVMGGCS